MEMLLIVDRILVLGYDCDSEEFAGSPGLIEDCGFYDISDNSVFAGIFGTVHAFKKRNANNRANLHVRYEMICQYV